MKYASVQPYAVLTDAIDTRTFCFPFSDAGLDPVYELPFLLAVQRDLREIDSRCQVDVTGHVPGLSGLEDEHRRDRPAAEQVAREATLVAVPRQLPDAGRRDAVFAVREVGAFVLQERPSRVAARCWSVFAPSSVHRGTHV